MGQLYELRITATGEVRDADGNLISQEPVETTVTVTEEQARQLMEEQ
jgi:hypothetical protein